MTVETRSRARLKALMRNGMDDAEIVDLVLTELCGDNIVKRRNFSSNVKERVRYARARPREEAESRPLEKRGPWPVAHVYPPSVAFPSGMPVYDVGGGHLVQGSAVAALGWRAG